MIMNMQQHERTIWLFPEALVTVSTITYGNLMFMRQTRTQEEHTTLGGLFEIYGATSTGPPFSAGLKMAMLFRRAATCIQRCWRTPMHIGWKAINGVKKNLIIINLWVSCTVYMVLSSITPEPFTPNISLQPFALMQNVTRWHDSVLYLHTMCILFASCARLESLQAKNWALSRCCPRGPLGENIYPLHRGTFVERLEHHCHGGSLPVLAGRDGGEQVEDLLLCFFLHFLGGFFRLTSFDYSMGTRSTMLFHLSGGFTVWCFLNMGSHFHRWSSFWWWTHAISIILLCWCESAPFCSLQGQIDWRIRPDQHLVEESQLAMGFAEAPVILRAPSPRGTLRELWRWR